MMPSPSPSRRLLCCCDVVDVAGGIDGGVGDDVSLAVVARHTLEMTTMMLNQHLRQWWRSPHVSSRSSSLLSVSMWTHCFGLISHVVAGGCGLCACCCC